MRTQAEIRNHDWFGSLPEGWEMKPMGSLFSFSKGITVTKSDLTEDGAPVVNYGQIHSKANTGTKITSNLIRYISSDKIPTNTNPARKGSFIFACTSEDLQGCGNCIYLDSEIEVYAGGDAILLSPLNNGKENKYLAYQFLTDEWRFQIRRDLVDVKVFHVNRKNLKEAYVVLPPPDVRRSLVSFLDARCAPIDEAITRHRQAIDKLEEYRRAVIIKAVTKGLDPNVPMKDSGVAWIGMIPASWHAKRIKFVARLASGGTPSRDHPEYWDGNIPWVTTGDLNGGEVSETKENITQLGLENSSSKIFPRRTVLVAMYGGAGTIGKCGILGGDFAINQAICAIACRSGLEPNYLLYQMHAIRPYWMRHASGTRKDPNISQALIANEKIVVPPHADQLKIISELNHICSGIDSSINRQNHIIEKLEEYRRGLIHAAVTGKIDCTKESL